MDSPVPGLDSPQPRRQESPFRMDITPLRTNQVNLFFSPAQEDDDDAGAAEGTYVRKTAVPEVYTRTARRIVDDEESDEERVVEEEQPSKKPRTNANGSSNAAARLAASRRPADARTSALSLFDEPDDFMQQSAQLPGDQTESFDPLKGPVGMMNSTPGEADDGGEKRKRTRPKLDVERLLGDRGLPALIKDAKRFRIRGKGHEAKDLNNLLSTYQMWTHQLFPIMPFTETVTRVETLCHSKLAKSALRGYREKDREMREALFRSPTPPAADIPGDSTTSGNATSVNHADGNFAAGNTREPILRASAVPETGMDMEIGMDEEEDFEAMIAAAEEEATAAQSLVASTGTGKKLPPPAGTANDDDDEDFEAMIAAAEAEAEEAHRGAAAGTTSGMNAVKDKGVERGGDEYDDDWAAMDGM